MFENLSIKGKVARMALPELGPNAALYGRPANQSNPEYVAGITSHTELSPRRARQVDRNPAAQAQEIERNRDDDRAVFPSAVFEEKWDGILEEGVEIPPTLANREKFCRECPEWLFDRVRDFYAAPESFLEGSVGLPDATAFAGNSDSGSSSS